MGSIPASPRGIGRSWTDGEVFGTTCCANTPAAQLTADSNFVGREPCRHKRSCVFCLAASSSAFLDIEFSFDHILGQLNEEWNNMFGTQELDTFEQGMMALGMILEQPHCLKLKMELARKGHLALRSKEALSLANRANFGDQNLAEARLWNKSSGGFQVRVYRTASPQSCQLWFFMAIAPYCKNTDLFSTTEHCQGIAEAGMSIAWLRKGPVRRRPLGTVSRISTPKSPQASSTSRNGG